MKNLTLNSECTSLSRVIHYLLIIELINVQLYDRELQMLISGDQRPIDITDMRRHVNYAGGYHDSQPYIQSFWDVIASLSPEEQGEFLQFITSCPRQPLRGFGQMNPLICIQVQCIYLIIPNLTSTYS